MERVKRDDGGSSKARGKKGGGGSGGGGPLPPRRLPKPIPQLVLTVLLKRLRKNTGHFGIVSDLSNNIYSTEPLEQFNVVGVHSVRMAEVDQTILQEDDDGEIKVTITSTGQQIDTRQMQWELNTKGTWRGFELETSIKTTLEQVNNAIVKSLPTYKFIPLGRSNLIRWPENQGTGDLGGGVVCWKGISANVAMGWQPYLSGRRAYIFSHSFAEFIMVIYLLFSRLIPLRLPGRHEGDGRTQREDKGLAE